MEYISHDQFVRKVLDSCLVCCKAPSLNPAEQNKKQGKSSQYRNASRNPETCDGEALSAMLLNIPEIHWAVRWKLKVAESQKKDSACISLWYYYEMILC